MFTTEKAPWKGAMYERLIGVIKPLLKKAIGRKRMNHDELQTIVKEAELAVNSRPITRMDGESLDYLTPQMFLAPHATKLLPIGQGEDGQDPDYQPKMAGAEGLRQAQKLIQNRLNCLWENWKINYLQWIKERAKLKHKANRSEADGEPKVGQVVL
uniref:Integrase catalytic domain-containing protein n=1 Tax=Panagrolaimus sp. JU765 TaxID=591449 RepID=A0AC34RPZ5_9BILA